MQQEGANAMVGDEQRTLWSIGHSKLPIERFIELLREHQITLVADVRTAPYSRHWPQFNREELARGLELADV